MQRVKRSTAVQALPAPPVGGTAGFFAKADPLAGTPATIPGYEWFNNVQEELCSLVESQDLALSDIDRTQVAQAIKRIFQRATGIAAAASGTVDAITANFDPAITALKPYMLLIVRAAGANTSATPTFTPASASVPAKVIVKGHNQPLMPGDISGVGFPAELQYDAALDKWVLLNPAHGVTVPAFVQANSYSVANAGGTANAITASYTPSIGALTNGMTLNVRPSAANTIAAVTFTPNSATIPAKAIVKGAGAPLLAGDIDGAGHWIELQYDAALDKWVLRNPAKGVNGGNFQPNDATLSALAALVTAADQLIYATGPDTFAMTPFTALARTLLGAADQGAARSAIGAIARSDVPVILNAPGAAPLYACRAWVNFNGTGTVAIRAAGNVSSVTDNGVGDYTINFTTPLADANYSVISMARPTTAAYGQSFTTNVHQATLPTAAAVRVANTFQDDNSNSVIYVDSDVMGLAVFR